MAGLPITNWIRFVVWLILGLFVYYFYSRHHSELARDDAAARLAGGEKR